MVMRRGVVVVRRVVVVGSLPVLVSAFAVLARTTALFLGHADFHFYVLVLPASTV